MTEFQISTPNDQKPLKNYLVLIAAFTIMATFGGLRFSFGVFFKPLISDLGWTRAVTSGAFSLTGLMQGLAGLLLGRMTDRFGAPKVLIMIGLFLGTGYLLMSQVSEIWQLYLFYGVIIGIGNSVHVPVLSTIAKRFKSRRGLMTGITMAGVGAGQLILSPIAAILIETYNWRVSYIIFGITALIIMSIASQFMKIPQKKDTDASIERESLQDLTSKFDSITVKSILRTRQIWIIMAIHFFLGFCIQAIFVHLVPYVTDLGVAPTTAASLLSVAGVSVLVARLIMGNAADSIGEEKVFLLGFLLMFIGLLSLFFIKQTWTFYAVAIFTGFTQSAAMAGSTLVARLYGVKAHATIFSMPNFAITVGAAVGPYLFGYIHDLTDSYHEAFLTGMLIAGLGIISSLVLPLDRSK